MSLTVTRNVTESTLNALLVSLALEAGVCVCVHDCVKLNLYIKCQNTSLLPFATRKANKIEKKNTLLILAAISLPAGHAAVKFND